MFILLLSFQICWSSTIHSGHDDEVSGSVMRRESLKVGLHGEEVHLRVDDPNSDHLAVAEDAQWRARILTATAEQKEATAHAEAIKVGSQPFAATATHARSTVSGQAVSVAAPSPVPVPSPVPHLVQRPSPVLVAVAPTAQASESYIRKYTTTSRRTMTIEVSTESTTLATLRSSTSVAASETIPLKIPAHMHAVVAPGSNFPEELSASSWKTLQARTSTTTLAIPVEASVDAAAKVAQQAAQRAGASEADAAVQAAKAAAWMINHEQSMGHQTSTVSTTPCTATSQVKPDAMESDYTTAAESIQNKYGSAEIPFASNRSKVMKEVNLTGRAMRVGVVTADGDLEVESTSEAPEPVSQLKKMDEMIDQVVLKDLPKIVAAVAAKITQQPFESEVPKAASRMVVKLLTEIPVKDVPQSIVDMLMELAFKEHPTMADPLPVVADALEQTLDDYRVPEKESISKVVDQAMQSTRDLEEAAQEPPAAEPQNEKVLRVITDTADRLAKKEEETTETEEDDSTTPAMEESAEASSDTADISATDETDTTETEEGNSTNLTIADGEPINSAEILPDEDTHTAAEIMKSAKEHKGSDVAESASASSSKGSSTTASSQRHVAVHSVHTPTVVKAVSATGSKNTGGDDHEEEEDLEVESPAKSGGKVLVGLTVFLGSLLMVVAISSAGYMAYQRSQEQRPGAAPTAAAPTGAAAGAPATEAPAPSASSRPSRASGSGAGGEAEAAPTFTGGPEAGA